MKALVLCGGLPQAALIEELKSRGIETILADLNPNVLARPLADRFYRVSALDAEAVTALAAEEKVDFVITACADQVLLIQAQVSEALGLPCYIDYETAKKVSSKELMKKAFIESGIPTSKYVILKHFDAEALCGLAYPLIVKPVDSYSSRGVRKVCSEVDLKAAIDTAAEISRTNTVIIEEYVEGKELSVDVYVEDGKAHVLCISDLDKIPGNGRFVICRTRYPAQISDAVKTQVQDVADRIACAFKLENSPMLIQMITDGRRISVVEFCARTGGGDKFQLVKDVLGFDVIKAVVDLTLGEKPHVEAHRLSSCIVNEFLYATPGVFDHLEGFDAMKESGVIDDYFQLKWKGMRCGEVKSSGDRVAYYTIHAQDIETARERDRQANRVLRVMSDDGRDLLRHDLIATY